VVGVGNYLRKKHPSVRIHPLEPAESPTLTTGYKVGAHRIQGISDEFIPSIVNLNSMDEVIQASDGDSILMASKTCQRVRTSRRHFFRSQCDWGHSIAGRMGWDSTVVTIFPDSNKKYLSTDLMKQEPLKENYLSPQVRFRGLM